MLPGMKIEPYYDRADLIAVTTETVQENLVLGMVLVTAILPHVFEQTCAAR